MEENLMPRKGVVGLVVGLMLAGSNQAVGQDAERTVTPQATRVSYSPDTGQRAIEFERSQELYAALSRWLDTATAEDGDVCDRIASEIISTGDPSVEMWFLAAKVAEVRGQIEKAMEILKDIAEHRGQEKTPGFQAPAGVSANMWLGRLARESGKLDVAMNAFEQAAVSLGEYPQLQFLSSLCRMYQGEVQADFLGETEHAKAAYGEASEGVNAGAADFVMSPDVLFSLWARWKLAEIDAGTARKSCPESLKPLIYPMSVQMLALNGIIASPRVDFYAGPRRHWQEKFMREALRTSRGRIDTDALRLVLAQFRLEDKANQEAEEILNGIDETSFFSSIAAEESARIHGLGPGTSRENSLSQFTSPDAREATEANADIATPAQAAKDSAVEAAGIDIATPKPNEDGNAEDGSRSAPWYFLGAAGFMLLFLLAIKQFR
jgi:tetratricopeptide (TPR) repeat protein